MWSAVSRFIARPTLSGILSVLNCAADRDTLLELSISTKRFSVSGRHYDTDFDVNIQGILLLAVDTPKKDQYFLLCMYVHTA